ncbi:MAG TPA: hypothetical protein DET40_01785 [Lentisphaeria bacterium]|nr:MAG: hypothetical protein A2X45_11635 [Lentisphaerae bacterium GWF2_50_93]HCE42263.1 hypothetical protein [Lentisphaeria bacterium]
MKRKLNALLLPILMLLVASESYSQNPQWRDSDTNVISNEAYAVTKNVVAAKFANLVLKKADKELTADNLLITSKDDPDFSAGVKASQVGYWVKPIRYTLRKNLCVKGTWFFLFIDKELKAGKTYSVSVKDLTFEPLSFSTGKRDKDASPTAPELSFTWQGDFTRSTAVHVNQAGYLPDSRKYAYLTQYAGWRYAKDNSPLDIDFSSYKDFKIVDADTGKEVYKGQIRISPVCLKDDKPVNDRLTDSRVWEMDFSDFKTPGRYRVIVPGAGASFPFGISAKVYNHVLGTLMRGFYHQRCGTELLAEYTRFTHPLCHKDDARIPAIEEYKCDEADFYPQEANKVIPCAKGHHDAGDYGKYVTNGSLVVFNLLLPFEIFPGKMQFDNSPLPNSGNGIPDLIEEAKWELDWLSNMQDSDGLVFLLVKPDPTMSYEDSIAGKPSKQFNKQRVVWWKDIHITAGFAASLARAARTPEIVKYYPEDAKTYLEKAKKAWDACMKHVDKDGEPDDLVKGPAQAGSYLGAKDEYCWMAVELWLTTGEQKYHDYFLKNFNPKDSVQWGWWPLFVHAGAATRAYVFGKREGKNPEKLKECTDYVVNAARSTMKWQDGWATRCSFAEDPFRFGKWGWYYLSEIASYNLLAASVLVDDVEKKKFIQAVLFNADQELGNSADDAVSISGLGFKRPVDMVNQNSRFDGIIEPVSGIPMGFHPAGYNVGNQDRELMSSYTKGGMPIAYRYVDCWWVEQEFMCPQLADTAVVYAYLSDLKDQKKGKPSLKLTADGAENSVVGNAPFKVRLKAEASGANGKKVIQYFWDLQNEEFACDKEFEYTFSVPGLYNVCCTVTDEDGWISYSYIDIRVAQSAAELPNKGEPFKADTDTMNLWHFDDNATDAVSNIQIKLLGGAKLSDRNLLWMAKRSGKAVELVNPEDGLQIEFNSNLIMDKKYRTMRIEMMANYQEDYSRGVPSTKIFSLECSWDCYMGVNRDTWAGRVFQGSSDEAIKKKAIELVAPAPGWHIIAVGYDRSTGKGYIEKDGKKVEFDLQTKGGGDKTVMTLGGFKGFIDELRITAKIDTALAAPAKSQKK